MRPPLPALDNLASSSQQALSSRRGDVESGNIGNPLFLPVALSPKITWFPSQTGVPKEQVET